MDKATRGRHRERQEAAYERMKERERNNVMEERGIRRRKGEMGRGRRQRTRGWRREG